MVDARISFFVKYFSWFEFLRKIKSLTAAATAVVSCTHFISHLPCMYNKVFDSSDKWPLIPPSSSHWRLWRHNATEFDLNFTLITLVTHVVFTDAYKLVTHDLQIVTTYHSISTLFRFSTFYPSAKRGIVIIYIHYSSSLPTLNLKLSFDFQTFPPYWNFVDFALEI